MTIPSWRSKRFWIPAALVVAVVAGVGVWLLRDRFLLPKPGSARYEEYVIYFQVGTAALDAGPGLVDRVEEPLSRAIELIPQEPAAWANRGLFYLRGSQLEKAAADLARADELVPNHPDIRELLGYLAEREGKIDDAIAHFERACPEGATIPSRLYSLFRLAEARGGPDADANRAKVLERLVAIRPNSLPILMDRALLAARRRDLDTLRDTFTRLEKLAPDWKGKDEPRKMLAALRKEAEGNFDPLDYRDRLQKLKNVLPTEAGYQTSSGELQPIAGLIGDSLQQFLVLKPIHSEPDAPDRELTFTNDSFANLFRPDAFRTEWKRILPVWLGRVDRPVLFVASGKEVRRVDADQPRMVFPGGDKETPPSMDGVLAFDWNNDYRTDFLLVGAGGLRFYEQKQDGSFADTTPATKLPVVDYYGAWAVDIDQDGDLDVILAPRKGPVVLLRNDGKGNFTEMPIFPGVENVRGFAWLDLDNDGANDAVLLDAEGKLHVFMNERSGQFSRRDVPSPDDRYQAICAADVNDDGVLDLIAVRTDGVVLRFSDRDKRRAWDSAELARHDGPPVAPGEVRLSAVDLDNNGAVDLVYRTESAGAAWLADGKGAFEALAAKVPGGLTEIFSFDEGGQYDLVQIERITKPVHRH